MLRPLSSATPFDRITSSLENVVKTFGTLFLHKKDEELGDILHDLSGFSGAAIAIRKHIQLQGETPDVRETGEILRWLKASRIDPILYTTQLGRYYLPTKRFAMKASGLLAVCIDHGRSGYLLLFKPAIQYSIPMDLADATGNRNAPGNVADSGMMSQPWTEMEIGTAMRLQKKLQEAQRRAPRPSIAANDHQ